MTPMEIVTIQTALYLNSTSIKTPKWSLSVFHLILTILDLMDAKRLKSTNKKQNKKSQTHPTITKMTMEMAFHHFYLKMPNNFLESKNRLFQKIRSKCLYPFGIKTPQVYHVRVVKLIWLLMQVMNKKNFIYKSENYPKVQNTQKKKNI